MTDGPNHASAALSLSLSGRPPLSRKEGAACSIKHLCVRRRLTPVLHVLGAESRARCEDTAVGCACLPCRRPPCRRPPCRRPPCRRPPCRRLQARRCPSRRSPCCRSPRPHWQLACDALNRRLACQRMSACQACLGLGYRVRWPEQLLSSFLLIRARTRARWSRARALSAGQGTGRGGRI